MLAVIETHPVQYHAPLYRVLQTEFGIPTTAIYGSDFSIAGYRDEQFGATFAWEGDLLSGYSSVFLSRVAEGGARNVQEVSARGLREALRKVQALAVMVLGYSPRFYQAACYEAWRSGRPILFRGETTDQGSRSWLRRQALQWWYRRCARLLFIGQRAYRHFKLLGCPEEKLVFSPYGVDTSLFQCDETARPALRKAARSALGLEESRKVVLFSGKLYRAKGPELLLQAVKELPEKVRRNVAVLFLGAGKLEDTLRRLAAGSPAVETHFVGFQNQTRLSPYYHAADLLALPSFPAKGWRETWGLVVNEALHHGVPCVVSDSVGCAPDLIAPGQTGEVCETRSVASLAAAILRLLPYTGAAETRECCRARVAGYTLDKTAAGIARAYDQVISLADRGRTNHAKMSSPARKGSPGKII